MTSLLKRFENMKPFTESEAWMLFRLSAIAEACGWTLLIAGILIRDYLLHGNDIPVQIAGRIHGTLFLIYLVAAVVLYPSLGWSRKKAFVAAVASVPPYGSLLFEQWAAHKRHHIAFQTYRNFLAYSFILEKDVGLSATLDIA